MLNYWGAALALAVSAIAGPAPAQEAPRIATFSVGATRLQLQLPEGYCVADEDPEFAAMIRGDTALNETHLVLMRCGEHRPEHDFYVIKSRLDMHDRQMTRASYFRLLRPQFDSPQARENLAAMTRGVAGRDTGLSVTGGLKPMGMDESCAYIGGVMSFSKDGKGLGIVQGTCATALPNAVFAVYSTGFGETDAEVMRHIGDARALAMQVTLAPSH